MESKGSFRRISGGFRSWHSLIIDDGSAARTRRASRSANLDTHDPDNQAVVNSGRDSTYVQGDHLGSSSTLTNGLGNVVARERYSAFGERRKGETYLITDQLYTGQRLNVLSGLYHYSDGTSAGRFYDPLLARFVQADPMTPSAGSAGLNRYTYALNSPLVFNDPNGYDPLDQQWRSDFEAEHGRPPDARDEQIRLFSLAYYDEWDPGYFYNSDGTVNVENMRTRFQSPSGSRSWDTMGNGLLALSAFYLEDEQAQFVRDVGFLYGGLASRSQNTGVLPYWNGAVPGNLAVFIRPGSIDPSLIYSTINPQNDEDANVHHWAVTFVMGWHIGPRAANAINEAREFQQGEGMPWNRKVDTSDVEIGRRGSQIGWALKGSRSYDVIPGLLRQWLGIGR